MKTRLLLLFIISSLISFGQSVSIGDILCTDETIVSRQEYPNSGKTALGIVFFIDVSDSHGWAVALKNQASSIQWSSESYYGYDLPSLPNYENARVAMHDLNGKDNTEIIRNEGFSNAFPAAWAVDFDNGWYLPSAGQLRYLFSYCPEINASLQVVGGTTIPYWEHNYFWSSTEFTGFHAYDMNTGGSLGDYVKDNNVNYPPNGIAVRQIRDFNIPNPTHPTYHVGDLITNEDGSQGILFSISPDQTDGWMVALNDVSSQAQWGNTGNVPGLTNQTCSAPYGILLEETNGYENTGYIRNYETDPTMAAKLVDYEHDWYLPTAGQLSTLFGALAIIENKLQTYGSTLSEDYYWSSSEANTDEAFALCCYPNLNVRAGHFLRCNKSTYCHVRAVRNLVLKESSPSVGLIDTPEPICANESLGLHVPETNNATSQGWQLSPTPNFIEQVVYDGEPIDFDYNGWYLRYYASNQIDTVYSNIVSISVRPDSSHISQIHGETVIYYKTNGPYTYSIDTVPDCLGYEWNINNGWSISYSHDSPECTVNINSPGTATLYVRVYTECGIFERSIFINHDAHPDVVIYPNPVLGDFNIVLNGMHGQAVIVIYDCLGQFLGRISVNTDLEDVVVPFSLASYAAGLYFVTITNDSQTIIRKVEKVSAAFYGYDYWSW